MNEDERFKKMLETSKIGDIAKLLKPSSTLLALGEKLKHANINLPDLSSTYISAEPLPTIEPPKIKSNEELNHYQSASTLMAAIAQAASDWKRCVPEGFQPAVMAIISGGIHIHVSHLSQVSFHGIRVEGTLDGAPCSLMAHQATIQILCYAEKIVEDVPAKQIGFIWDNGQVNL